MTLGLSRQDSSLVNIGIIVSVSILLFQFCSSAVLYQYQLWGKQRSCHRVWLPDTSPPLGAENCNVVKGASTRILSVSRLGAYAPLWNFLLYSCSVMPLKMTALYSAY